MTLTAKAEREKFASNQEEIRNYNARAFAKRPCKREDLRMVRYTNEHWEFDDQGEQADFVGEDDTSQFDSYICDNCGECFDDSWQAALKHLPRHEKADNKLCKREDLEALVSTSGSRWTLDADGTLLNQVFEGEALQIDCFHCRGCGKCFKFSDGNDGSETLDLLWEAALDHLGKQDAAA